jgi:hypothetical protein
MKPSRRPPRGCPNLAVLRKRGPALCALTLAAPLASAQQVHFSVDWKSHTLSRPSSTAGAQPITEGDILQPPPGFPTYGPYTVAPGIAVSGFNLQLQGFGGCVGHQAGTPCEIEVDSLSSGHDDRFLPNQLGGTSTPRRRVWFSVDEWAAGHVLTPTSPPHPTVLNQGNPTVPPTSSGVFEACADVFIDTNLPSGPIGPGFAPRNNVGIFDGDGLPSPNGFVYYGLGLIEPKPTTTPFPYPGDNLDALEVDANFGPGSVVYFSLDSAFVDPRTGVPNTGSAAANGFVGGAVLKTVLGGGSVTLYASAVQLGLDHTAPDQDDLDALALADNGDGIYQPSLTPYDWLLGGTDMLVFSVRRGSAIINQPDSIFGAPIQPGDLLIPPVAGGLNNNPGIFIAAEALGLRTFRGISGQQGDDLDALDVSVVKYFDCNENGVEDAVDIANGSSIDANSNGIPDECEDGVIETCMCPEGSGMCGNDYATGGCENSTTLGAKLLSNVGSGGTTSIANDDLVLTTSQLPLNVSGMVFMGASPKTPTPFYDGLRCIESPVLRYPLANSGPSGQIVLGPGIAALAAIRFGVPGTIDAGENWYFQTWYRDSTGPCGNGSNLSNSVRVTFTP